ncbi:MAG: glycoside hydrolase N-terminal domain-containing protein [Candidatus Aminicenantes bacterium]|nr:MAG: glycoside hydrolase N-terminal domain-containing protein [Candidatus Aminicenantes bacterium]
MRYQGRVKALADGGTTKVEDTDLVVTNADIVTLFIAAATNFVNYKDVSAGAGQRVEMTLQALEGKP